MNICRDCKFHTRKRRYDDFSSYVEDKCGRKAKPCPVNGELEGHRDCGTERLLPWRCGRKGRHFQPKGQPE